LIYSRPTFRRRADGFAAPAGFAPRELNHQLTTDETGATVSLSPDSQTPAGGEEHTGVQRNQR
jgi:hypothetical protein